MDGGRKERGKVKKEKEKKERRQEDMNMWKEGKKKSKEERGKKERRQEEVKAGRCISIISGEATVTRSKRSSRMRIKVKEGLEAAGAILSSRLGFKRLPAH